MAAEKFRLNNLQNKDLWMRNFEGRAGEYNDEGVRSFLVSLDYDLAVKLEADGWNIKWPKENPNQVDPQQVDNRPYLPVEVGLDKYPARIYTKLADDPNSEGLRMPDEAVKDLDWAELLRIDLIIRPYEWTRKGKSGVKAYLEAGQFVMLVDSF